MILRNVVNPLWRIFSLTAARNRFGQPNCPAKLRRESANLALPPTLHRPKFVNLRDSVPSSRDVSLDAKDEVLFFENHRQH
jgi:hypothetical protein